MINPLLLLNMEGTLSLGLHRHHSSLLLLVLRIHLAGTRGLALQRHQCGLLWLRSWGWHPRLGVHGHHGYLRPVPGGRGALRCCLHACMATHRRLAASGSSASQVAADIGRQSRMLWEHLPRCRNSIGRSREARHRACRMACRQHLALQQQH